MPIPSEASYEKGSLSRARLINHTIYALDFIITGQHLALIGRLSLGWYDGPDDDTYEGCVMGSPKRPYGNSDIEQDIAEITDPAGYAAIDWDDPAAWNAYLAGHLPALRKLHIETVLALQVICETGQFRAGRFRRGSVLEQWQPAPDAS